MAESFASSRSFKSASISTKRVAHSAFDSSLRSSPSLPRVPVFVPLTVEGACHLLASHALDAEKTPAALAGKQSLQVRSDRIRVRLYGGLPQSRQDFDNLYDFTRADGALTALHERAVRFKEKARRGQLLDHCALSIRLNHGKVDREVASKVHGSSRLGCTPGEPMEDHLAGRGGKVLFKQIEHRLRGSRAVNRQDLPSFLSTESQHVRENLSLSSEGSKEAGASIQPDFTDVARFVEVRSPQLYLSRPLCDQLRMEAESRANVLRCGHKVAITRPSLGCSRDCEREYMRAFAGRDGSGMIWVEVEVAVKINEPFDHHHLSLAS